MKTTTMTAAERWKQLLREIPDTKTILNASIRNLGLTELSKADARSRFGIILGQLMDEGWRLLQQHQGTQRVRFFREALKAQLPTLPAAIERELLLDAAPRETAARVVEVVIEHMGMLPEEYFSIPQKSIGQQAKKRAGVHMERAMAFLFRRAGLPFEQQRPKRSDFVFPDLETWESTPELAVLVSAKRTLAERWKQLAAERHDTGRNAYLVTLDDLAVDKARRLTDHGFTLYVRPEVKDALPSSPRIRNLNDLPGMIAKVINRE